MQIKKVNEKFLLIGITIFTACTMVFSMYTLESLRVGWHGSGDARYYLTSDNEKATGWLEVDGNTYYFDEQGKMQFSWQTIDNQKYYFKSDGQMAIGDVTIKKEKYHFQKDGKFLTGWNKKKTSYYDEHGFALTGWQTINNVVYYFDSKGKIATKWQTIDNAKYYFNETGNYLTGWQTIDGKRYYFNNNGQMLTQWQTINNAKYFLGNDGALVSGEIVLNNQPYYLQSDGQLYTGWKTIDGNLYYFDWNGYKLTNTTKDGYSINENGVATKITVRVPSNQNINTSSLNMNKVLAALNNAIGVPYRHGGTTMNGFDCSGLVYYAYAQSGVYLPKSSYAYSSVGTPVTYANAKPGDILLWTNVSSGAINHVGVYVGNGTMIHASSRGVRRESVSRYKSNNRLMGVRRIG